jgi:hypothetical protein
LHSPTRTALELTAWFALAGCAVGVTPTRGAVEDDPDAPSASSSSASSLDDDAGEEDAAPSDAGARDAKSDAAGSRPPSDAALACPGYALPHETGTCHACTTSPTCQPNGCFNGYYCELSSQKCRPKPSGC